VKWIGLGLLLVIVAGWTASNISWSWLTPAESLTPWDWRRTRNGWEQAEWLMPPTEPRKPVLHPSVVAMLELLLSIGGLAAYPARSRGAKRLAPAPTPAGDVPTDHFPVPGVAAGANLLTTNH
jgi:hypothetical protein